MALYRLCRCFSRKKQLLAAIVSAYRLSFTGQAECIKKAWSFPVFAWPCTRSIFHWKKAGSQSGECSFSSVALQGCWYSGTLSRSCSIPALITWFIAERIGKKGGWSSWVYIPCLVFCFSISRYLVPQLDLPQAVVNKQHAFLKIKHGNTSVPINVLEPTAISFLKNTPQAIKLTLFRPQAKDITCYRWRQLQKCTFSIYWCCSSCGKERRRITGTWSFLPFLFHFRFAGNWFPVITI